MQDRLYGYHQSQDSIRLFFISFNNFEDFLEFAQELSNAMKKC